MPALLFRMCLFKVRFLVEGQNNFTIRGTVSGPPDKARRILTNDDEASSIVNFRICRQIGIVSTGKKVCLRSDESLVEQSGMMAWGFESSHIRSKHISTYMSQQTIYPLQR